ncbi:hypothetical protein [Vibrio phage BONAISHI]|nr:hypothetical protein [Vibrio phage BONAISHI]
MSNTKESIITYKTGPATGTFVLLNNSFAFQVFAAFCEEWTDADTGIAAIPKGNIHKVTRDDKQGPLTVNDLKNPNGIDSCVYIKPTRRADGSHSLEVQLPNSDKGIIGGSTCCRENNWVGFISVTYEAEWSKHRALYSAADQWVLSNARRHKLTAPKSKAIYMRKITNPALALLTAAKDNPVFVTGDGRNYQAYTSENVAMLANVQGITTSKLDYYSISYYDKGMSYTGEQLALVKAIADKPRFVELAAFTPYQDKLGHPNYTLMLPNAESIKVEAHSDVRMVYATKEGKLLYVDVPAGNLSLIK